MGQDWMKFGAPAVLPVGGRLFLGRLRDRVEVEGMVGWSFWEVGRKRADNRNLYSASMFREPTASETGDIELALPLDRLPPPKVKR